MRKREAVSSFYPSVIGAIKDSLSKPDLHPRAREVLERRLEHHLDRLGQRRYGATRESLSKGQKISAQRRAERGRRKRQEVLPMILKLREEGRTYKEIEVDLRLAGVTSTKGTPYSKITIGAMVKNNSPRPASGRKVDTSVRRLAD